MQVEKIHAQFEALLLQPILRPLEEAFGPYGDLGAQAFAQALARGFEHGDE